MHFLSTFSLSLSSKIQQRKNLLEKKDPVACIKHEYLSPANLKYTILTKQAEIQVRSQYFSTIIVCTEDFTSAVLA